MPSRSANVKFVPIVGADNNGFIGQMIDLKDDGSGRHRGDQSSGGRRSRPWRRARRSASGKQEPHLDHLTPEVHDNTTDERAWRGEVALYDPKVDPSYPVYGRIKH